MPDDELLELEEEVELEAGFAVAIATPDLELELEEACAVALEMAGPELQLEEAFPVTARTLDLEPAV